VPLHGKATQPDEPPLLSGPLVGTIGVVVAGTLAYESESQHSERVGHPSEGSRNVRLTPSTMLMTG
jgi:hypothetical protein